MSGFTESAFERKLAELNPSQQSIQGLSAWIIHQRKHANTIVKTWYREFMKAQEHRKLTFLYLANDIVQNSRKKGNELGKSFLPIFKKTFDIMAKTPGDKTKQSVLRILGIWKERGIYEMDIIKNFEKNYLKLWTQVHDQAIEIPGTNESLKEETATELNNSTSEGPPEKKMKKDQHHKPHRKSHSEKDKEKEKEKRRKKDELRKKALEDANTVDEWEVDGVVQLEVKLSPSPYKEPPSEDELIQIIKELDNMPSTDAATRGKIAHLPPEVSDEGQLDELCVDSDVSRTLQSKIKGASDLLTEYSKKLDKELDTRKTASLKLQDFLTYQKDLLTQAEQRLEEHQSHNKVISKKLEELKVHVLNMPDLSKMPSVDAGLAPLPSAGDLFNI